MALDHRNKSIETMEKSINILVVEDNEYYNKLLSSTLRQRILSKRGKWNFKYKLHSFTDGSECITKIKSREFSKSDSIAFIDYHLGKGINGTHIIKTLKELTVNTTIVLLSQSKSVKEELYPDSYDYFILKDESAPALCCLCLEQYLDNKFYLPLD